MECLKYNTKDRREVPWFWIGAFLIICLIYVFRSLEVGTDTLSYADEFYHPKSVKNSEFIWTAINRILAITGEFRLLLLLCCSIYWLMFLKAIRYQDLTNHSLFLSLVFFLCVCVPDSFNIMRQCVAGSMWFYIYTKYLATDNPKYYRYVLYSLILTMVHTSILLLVPLVFFRKVILHKFVILSLWGLSIVSIITGETDSFVRILVLIGSIIPSGYFEYGHDAFLTEEGLLSGLVERNHITILLTNVPIFLFILMQDKIILNKRAESYYTAVVLLQIIVNMSYGFEVFNRVRVFLYLIEVFLLPYSVQLLRKPKNKFFSEMLYVIFFIFYIAFFFKTYYFGTANALFPNK